MNGWGLGLGPSMGYAPVCYFIDDVYDAAINYKFGECVFEEGMM